MENEEKYERKTKNREIFQDTINRIMGSSYLLDKAKESIENSLYIPPFGTVLPGKDITDGAEVRLTHNKSINAALAYKDERVVIHNYAQPVKLEEEYGEDLLHRKRAYAELQISTQ